MLKTITAVVAALLLLPLLLACSFAQPGGVLMLPGNSNMAPGKPGKMTVAVKGLKNLGRDGDTELVHVNPEEKRMLKKMGGSGTTNPKTGLKEYRFGGGGHGASNDSRSADRGNRDRNDRDDDIISGGGSDTVGHDPVSAVGDSRRDGAGITIERRKSVIDVAPGDERGGQSQRDGALLLEISTQPGGGLGEGGGSAAARKEELKKRGRAATLLSGSEGIKDKLGRSGRGGSGKGLG